MSASGPQRERVVYVSRQSSGSEDSTVGLPFDEVEPSPELKARENSFLASHTSVQRQIEHVLGMEVGTSGRVYRPLPTSPGGPPKQTVQDHFLSGISSFEPPPLPSAPTTPGPSRESSIRTRSNSTADGEVNHRPTKSPIKKVASSNSIAELIGSAHIAAARDSFGGMLSGDAIQRAIAPSMPSDYFDQSSESSPAMSFQTSARQSFSMELPKARGPSIVSPPPTGNGPPLQGTTRMGGATLVPDENYFMMHETPRRDKDEDNAWREGTPHVIGTTNVKYAKDEEAQTEWKPEKVTEMRLQIKNANRLVALRKSAFEETVLDSSAYGIHTAGIVKRERRKQRPVNTSWAQARMRVFAAEEKRRATITKGFASVIDSEAMDRRECWRLEVGAFEALTKLFVEQKPRTRAPKDTSGAERYQRFLKTEAMRKKALVQRDRLLFTRRELARRCAIAETALMENADYRSCGMKPATKYPVPAPIQTSLLLAHVVVQQRPVLSEVEQAAITIQRMVRGGLVRCRARRIRRLAAAIKIQKTFRGCRVRGELRARGWRKKKQLAELDLYHVESMLGVRSIVYPANAVTNASAAASPATTAHSPKEVDISRTNHNQGNPASRFAAQQFDISRIESELGIRHLAGKKLPRRQKNIPQPLERPPSTQTSLVAYFPKSAFWESKFASLRQSLHDTWLSVHSSIATEEATARERLQMKYWLAVTQLSTDTHILTHMDPITAGVVLPALRSGRALTPTTSVHGEQGKHFGGYAASRASNHIAAPVK